ncbi:MAG: ATP-binding cassette domain-containing protein [Flavobacterium sp.]|nr:ATP-binding cassette domain-containing protein [Flavobacterium sp.]
MSKTVIKVEQLSKAYQIGQIGTGTLSRDLERFWLTKIRGKADPFLKIGETNDRSSKGNSDVVWSLKDINFEVNQGEAVGIIGKNGAGKSTLLKVLSQITSPTSGEIKIKGRVASLLEVGTGFHAELTGRENIYLNGAILGMTRREISSKLDEIIDFSGCERYIDTPVKRFSSGMTVRLAFAVAAHLEPEILIVDEVLAVGDADFQKKAIGKMQAISKGEGRTILFVSHDMTAITALTNSVLIMNQGHISEKYPTELAIQQYLKTDSFPAIAFQNRKTEGDLYVESISFDENDSLQQQLVVGNSIRMRFSLNRVIPKKDLGALAFYVVFRNELNFPVFTLSNRYDASFSGGSSDEIKHICCEMPQFTLTEGTYRATTWMAYKNGFCDEITDAFELEVISSDFFKTGQMPIARKHGAFLVNQNWTAQ